MVFIMKNHHVILTGKGKFITPSSKYTPCNFTVPHNFEIIFWAQSGGKISDDLAFTIHKNPQTWYEKKVHKAYKVGSLCPNHLLYTPNHPKQNGLILDELLAPHIIPAGGAVLLSNIVDEYMISNLQHNKSQKIIIHWCANRTLDWHTK